MEAAPVQPVGLLSCDRQAGKIAVILRRSCYYRVSSCDRSPIDRGADPQLRRFKPLLLLSRRLLLVKKILYLPLLALGILALPARTLAHSVETNYFMSSGESLELQSVYSNGEPMAGAEVTIYAPGTAEPWQTVKTDAEGKFSFQPDRSIEGEWEVEIMQDGGMHGDALTVPVGDQGIELDNISQLEASDADYASLPQKFLGAIAATGLLAAGFLFFRREK